MMVYDDPRGLWKVDGNYITSSVMGGLLNEDGVCIRANRFSVRLANRFLGKINSCSIGQNEYKCLERIAKKELKLIKAQVKALRKQMAFYKDPLDDYSCDFVEFVLKTELVSEYERIVRILDDVDDNKPDNIDFETWIAHEVNHPGETLEQWKERAKREHISLPPGL